MLNKYKVDNTRKFYVIKSAFAPFRTISRQVFSFFLNLIQPAKSENSDKLSFYAKSPNMKRNVIIHLNERYDLKTLHDNVPNIGCL